MLTAAARVAARVRAPRLVVTFFGNFALLERRSWGKNWGGVTYSPFLAHWTGLLSSPEETRTPWEGNHHPARGYLFNNTQAPHSFMTPQ